MDDKVQITGYPTEEEVIQNLRDADCSEQMIFDFMEELHAGRQAQGVCRLRKYRQQLLEDIHVRQKRIDCLDYLLYAMKRGSQ